MLDLGAILKSGRLRMGMSQITLARKLGVNSSSISRWEKNQQVIAGDTLIEAAKILNITQELFPEYDINRSDGTPLTNNNVYNIVRSLQYKITALEEKMTASNTANKFKVIVAEDNLDVQISIQEAMFHLPTRYHIVHIYNEKEIIEFLQRSCDVSLIIISLTSEKINGRKIFNSLQKTNTTKVPIVLITDRKADKNINTGIVGYVDQLANTEAFLDVFAKIDFEWPAFVNKQNEDSSN
ncbi:helix-turn-helix domain-containing protein [Candidatus Uabimicrobium amorphum]|uniref:HTH cro/C1-type domain-containing protein n=1 Tax=Uabimicrobium amorphum TaxID=2596890 RepID=A0A5S9F7C3_UABAM|nr:helix-turn-helix transcriptional regulator [Candidatus Uabimicrobium amorphum]BBM88231.1 hypothetical protein UABAM_06652 [Candidatus Uabimicrobium amorphum]